MRKVEGIERKGDRWEENGRNSERRELERRNE